MSETSQGVESSNDPYLIEKSLEYKEIGNQHFKDGRFEESIEMFSKAIELDPENPIFYCNRSISYASLGEYEKSVLDARIAIDKRRDQGYVKAYYYLIKGLIELKHYHKAKGNLLAAFNRCGPSKELNTLEDLLMTKFGGHPIRPRPNDFLILEDLGEGNFTKVVKAQYKKTGYVYAIKTIEKATVERTKRRHPNIYNEIMMEKRVLSKLDYPLIVTLYSTFQDDYCLYYQIEYCAGGELWTCIKDRTSGSSSSVGCFESLAKFYILEAINTIEYMHKNGIVHRDIKLENIMLSSSGHIKFVDFGTCKDLIETDLNGPEFVGTAEYMSPYTVRSKPVGIDADIWALGVLLFQLLTGYTPFNAPSPYLSFLRIQRGLLKAPSFLSPSAQDLLSKLLDVNAWNRIEFATAQPINQTNATTNNNAEVTISKKEYPVMFMTKDYLASINYDKIRLHPYFNDAVISDGEDNRAQLFSTIHLRSACVVPKLKEYCIRAVGRACSSVAEHIAKNGGVKPDINWIQRFDLMKLSMEDRRKISHYLDRCDKLNPVNGVYRLFFTSNIDARCLRADYSTREYLRHYYSHHGHYSANFNFVFLSTSPSNPSSSTSTPESVLRSAISTVNRSRPKFLVVGGNLLACNIGDSDFVNEVNMFRKQVSRISETIPMLIVPSPNVVGLNPTPESLKDYHRSFGADYYGFWYSGTRILVINSTLLINRELAETEALAQDLWLEEEIEEAKLCSSHLLIFSYHPWFVSTSDDSHIDRPDIIPQSIRMKWLKRLRHKKVKYLFAAYDFNVQGKAFSREKYHVKVEDVRQANNTSDSGDPGNSEDSIVDNQNPVDDINEEPLKPSEIVQHSQGKDEGENSDDDNELVNEDLDYHGPFSVTTAPIELSEELNIRLVRVYEEDIQHDLCSLSNLSTIIKSS